MTGRSDEIRFFLFSFSMDPSCFAVSRPLLGVLLVFESVFFASRRQGSTQKHRVACVCPGFTE